MIGASFRGCRALAALSLGLGAVGALCCLSCDEIAEDELNRAVPELLHSKMASTAHGVAQAKWMHVAVPPEDGARLYPVALATKIFPEPAKESDPIGYLRVGENVARSEEPVSQARCPGGWYAVRPVGFVCQGEDATLDPKHPVVRALTRGPDRKKPLPYHYAFVRAIAPNYLRVPTRSEQYKYEMSLERHLKNYARLADKWDQMSPGANEVPLSDSGAASGPIPEGYVAPSYNERYGGSGDDSVPWWLVGERRIPNLSTFRAPPYAVMAGRIQRHAGVALVDTFVAGPEAQNRRFAVSVDGRLLPADKLKADTASAFHGKELSGELSLPVAFPYARVTRAYRIASSGLEVTRKLARREMVPLTGRVKRTRGIRFVETEQGDWLRSRDLKIAAEPSSLPWFARGKTRWVDLSIFSQTLVLYEGSRPVYVTLVSTGRDGLGDPKETLSTPTGTYRIYQKHVTTTMDSSAADNEFELRDVPWVMYFKGGYALHAAYWHDDFGRARSHGCVNLSPIDARYLFNWSAPDVPAHWHGAYSGETLGEGTLVHIHK